MLQLHWMKSYCFPQPPLMLLPAQPPLMLLPASATPAAAACLSHPCCCCLPQPPLLLLLPASATPAATACLSHPGCYCLPPRRCVLTPNIAELGRLAGATGCSGQLVGPMNTGWQGVAPHVAAGRWQGAKAVGLWSWAVAGGGATG